MELKEFYELYCLGLRYGKRKIIINLKDYTVEYFYKRDLARRTITVERLWKFIDKHRGTRIQGYNRPTICSKTFYTKQLESEE